MRISNRLIYIKSTVGKEHFESICSIQPIDLVEVAKDVRRDFRIIIIP